MMKNIAIIPARSGSKGLKNKNIIELNGRPLMSYSIEAAINSQCFDTIMVSTDSKEYAEIAKKLGAEVPFFRSDSTSTDAASSWDAVEEVLNSYQLLGKEYDTFCLLQPTSPLRSYEDIINAYKLFVEKKASVVVSITELEHPISWCGTIGPENSLENFISRNDMKRRQIQDRYYRPNGAIYICSTSYFKEDHYLYGSNSFAYIMPRERSMDIDTELDLRITEALINTFLQ